MLARLGRLTKFAALPLLFSSALVAQQSANPASSPDPCLRRTIPVTFIKNVQNPPPVRLQDLQVAVKGDQASIISLVQEKLTPRVILLVDTSGSMGPADRGSPKEGYFWRISMQAAKFAADAVPPGASVAMGTFSEHLQLSEFQDWASLSPQVLAFGKQKPSHRTALYDAVSNASALFKTPQFADAIYVVTDGGDNHSSIRLHQLEDDLAVRGVRVFVFLVMANQLRTAEERQGVDDMQDVAEKTGGGVITLLSTEWFNKPEAAAMAKSISDQVAAPNRMELQLTSPLNKPAKMSVTFPREPKAYTIVYPRLLQPCSKSAGQ